MVINSLQRIWSFGWIYIDWKHVHIQLDSRAKQRMQNRIQWAKHVTKKLDYFSKKPEN